MKDCFFPQPTMSLVLAVVVHMLVFGAVQGEGPLCHIMGSPEYPLLSKPGDFIIGGAFSIHSQITQPPLLFTEKPTELTCSR